MPTEPDATAESPCIGLCSLDTDGRFCLGCGRSLTEIAGWRSMSEAERRRVNERLRRAAGPLAAVPRT